ncbi:MAG TPA: helix-turn-helix domain-containing protein [Kofleriaceae bacterium]|jgi:AcrR family transcriptional regulator|nr:helix-turn-helix domain-containing protein [Kofleriaceae bacterium]
MARPAHADSAATRRKVLASALAMFAEHGVDGVSIREIAAAAGVSLATVHHYFGSKEELYAACVDSMYGELVAMRPQLAAALGKGGQPAELIDRIVRAAFRFAREHQIEMRLLMRQVMTAGELDDARRQVGQVPFLTEIPPVIAAVTGRPADSLRLPLQTMSFLISRYAVSTGRELELFTKKKGTPAIAAAEDHLVQVAAALFLQ